ELGDTGVRMIEPVAAKPVLATENAVAASTAAAPGGAPMEVQVKASADVAVGAQPLTSAQPFTREAPAAAASPVTPPGRIWSTNPFASSSTGLARPQMATTAPVAKPTEPNQPQSEVAQSSAPAPAWRFVGLAHGSYALFETAAG